MNKLIISLIWKLLERGGNQLVQLLVQIVMARLLSPEAFGSLAVMLVFVNLGGVLVQSGLNTALVQAPEADEDDFSTVFWMSLAVSLALYAVVFFAAPAVGGYYGDPGLAWPLRVLCLVLVVNAYNAVQVAAVQRAMEFRKVFKATMASALLSGALGVGCALAGAGLWALVAQQLSYQLINCLALALQVPWRPRAVFRSARARALFSFGWKLLASGLLDKGYQSLSDLIIGKRFSAAELGLVSQGKKYPQALGSMLDGAIQPVMLSAVSRQQGDVPQVKRLVRRALKTSTYLVCPCMALFAVAAGPLVELLLGEGWLPCVPFLQMYCVVYMLLPIHTTNLQALNGMGRSDLFLRLEVVKKAMGVSALLFAAFVLGDLNAIVGTYIFTGIISTLINAWPNRRVIDYPYAEQLRDMAPAFLLAAAAAAAAWPLSLLGLPALGQLALQAAAFAAAYLALSRLFRVEELSYLTSALRGLVASRGRG